MNIRARPSPDETRIRIMEVAEEHFRRVGYAKTAVADIAAALGMSPANVYRFFAQKPIMTPSAKQALEQNTHDRRITRRRSRRPRDSSASSCINSNRAQFVKEKRLHDMVEVATPRIAGKPIATSPGYFLA